MNTQKTTKEKIAVMEAFERGETIEVEHNGTGDWSVLSLTAPTWNWGVCNYRIKPKPTLRPWKPEEVPVGAIFKNTKYQSRCLILGDGAATSCGVAITCEDGIIRRSCQYMLDAGTYSVDNGLTWHPCGVLEG